jgi:hypothetical protein
MENIREVQRRADSDGLRYSSFVIFGGDGRLS